MGQSPKSEYYNNQGEGLPFLQGNRTFGPKYPIFDTYTRFSTRIAEAGHVIMSVRAPVGDVNITPVRMCLGRGVCSLHHNKGEQEFLYYLMRYYAQDLVNRQNGTVFGSVNRTDIAELEINIPPLPTQRAIAATLSCLDDKIELNRRINANLEAQAQAIFKNWFVDFEPFKDGKFVDSELGRIPRGWRVGTIGDVITLQRGHDLPINKTVPGNYPVLGSTGIIAYHNTYTTQAPCIVLGRSGNIGNPRYYNFDCWAHNTTIYIRTYNCEPLWIFFILEQLDYSQYKGGSAVPTLNRNHVETHTIIIPPDDIQLKFQSQISVIMDIIDNNIKQSRTLAAIRDTLLPKLMSGEIEVEEVL
jgi:type I restriction enzyme S subunit